MEKKLAAGTEGIERGRHHSRCYGNYFANRYGVSFVGDKNVLRVNVVMVA